MYTNIIKYSIKMRKREREGDREREGERGKDLIWAWLLNIYIKLLADHFIPGEVIPFLPHLQVTAVGWHSQPVLPHH